MTRIGSSGRSEARLVPEAMAPLPKGRAILAVFRELVAGLDAMAGIAPPDGRIQTGGGEAAPRYDSGDPGAPDDRPGDAASRRAALA